jgi:hypothetical protein
MVYLSVFSVPYDFCTLFDVSATSGFSCILPEYLVGAPYAYNDILITYKKESYIVIVLLCR